jgi:hypothetical protein
MGKAVQQEGNTAMPVLQRSWLPCSRLWLKKLQKQKVCLLT